MKRATDRTTRRSRVVALALFAIVMAFIIYWFWYPHHRSRGPSSDELKARWAALEDYHRRTDEAIVDLKAGRLAKAIAGLEEVVFSAIDAEVHPVPDRARPTWAEMLLLGLYRSAAGYGRSYRGMPKLESFIATHYPRYDPAFGQGLADFYLRRLDPDRGTLWESGVKPAKETEQPSIQCP